MAVAGITEPDAELTALAGYARAEVLRLGIAGVISISGRPAGAEEWAVPGPACCRGTHRQPRDVRDLRRPGPPPRAAGPQDRHVP